MYLFIYLFFCAASSIFILSFVKKKISEEKEKQEGRSASFQKTTTSQLSLRTDGPGRMDGWETRKSLRERRYREAPMNNNKSKRGEREFVFPFSFSFIFCCFSSHFQKPRR
jgi:hypothetical protein